MRLLRFCTIGALGAGLAFAVHPSAAAPVPPAGPAAEKLLHKVHRDHRECRWGYVEEWDRNAWHRHRRDGEPVACSRRRDDDRDWRPDRDDDDDRTCVQVGPVRVCQ